MYRIALLILVTGCIQETLVPCGDLACPQNYSCVADRCVSAAQLQACANVPAGGACTIDHVGGQCQNGACIAEVCGNGVLDPGEVCDDGNQISGDGCSGTCTSLETCGNAVVDVAVGEGCDCGGASNPSALCAHPNSADPSAECGLDCKPRFCGDGIVNTIEQCDGSVPDSVTCGDYGYYNGTVTCQSCQLDPASCSGRCGDGVIDSDHGEYCDQQLPADGSCLAFGWDNGNLTCGLGCGANLDDCRQWGWERAVPVTSRVSSLDGTGGMVAVAFDTGDAYVLAQGTWKKAPDQYSLVAVTATKAWAVGSNAIAAWDGTSWTTLMPPWPADTVLSSAWASDALGLFVGHANDGVLDRYTGTWSQIADGGWGATPSFEHTRSILWLSDFFGDAAWTFDGSTWSQQTGAPQYLTEDDTGHLWGSVGAELTIWDGTSWVSVGAHGGNGIAAGRGGMFVADIETSSGGHHTEDLWFYGQPPLHVADLPRGASESAVIAAGPDNMIYAGAGDGLFQLTRGEWEAYQTDAVQYNVVRGGRLSYGGDTYGGATYALDDGDVFEAAPPPVGTGCPVTTVTSRNELLAACTGGGTVVAGLWEGGTQVVTGVIVDKLWTAADDSGAAASGDSVFAWRGQGGWQTMSTSLHPIALDGDAVDDLYALDPQQGLMHFDGGMWAQLAADARPPLVVTPTRVYFGSSQGTKLFTRATQQITDAATPAGMNALVTTGGEELFAIASAEPRGSPLWRYDGSVWSPVRLPSGIQPQLLYGLGRALVVVAQQTNPTVPPTYILERVRGW